MAIQIRRGTNAEWESNKSNIVVGEPAVATDEGRFFIGTGTGTYAEMSNIENLAEAFDSSATYAVGDYCTYQGKLYVCNSATTGNWTSADWNEISVKQALDDLATRSVPTSVREAIYTLLNNCAYATTGLTDEIAIVESWAETVTSLTLSASTLSLSGSTPQTLIPTVVPSSASVSWSSSDNSIATVVGGVVTGVSNGSCVITATAGNLTATCAVTVTGFATLESISAVYTQGGTVYDTDSLDSLKDDLVVTATYDDSSTATIPSTDYTLSGTLTVGTSTITVAYGGKTTTFDVTVTHNDILYQLASAFTSDGTNYIDTDVAWELNSQYSLVCTFSISEFSSNGSSGTNMGFIFGDTHGEASKYTALSEQKYTSGSMLGRYAWGSGLGWEASKNFADVNQTIKFVFAWDIGTSTHTRNWYVKNVTAGTSKSGTQNGTDVLNIKGYNVFLGKQETAQGVQGFKGTITDFKIYDRLLTSDEISAYMG